jgi:amino acid adenylation domain-containing protein
VQAQLSFWKSKLAGSLPMSALPTDRPRPSVQTFNGRVLRIPLSTDLCRSLHAFSNQEEASLFVIMMSAFFTLAYRYTRQGDFCVGTSLANRQRPETEGLLGMLVNNVVLRAQMDAGLSFRDLLAQVRELTFEAYENQDVPLQDVVRAVNVNRDLRVNPLFQTTFNFHNSPVFVPEIPELQLQLVEALGNGAAKFDLGVIVIPASTQRLRLNPEWDKDAVVMLWEYNTDLFDESTIRRSVKHYEKILAGMIADPLKKITEAGLMDEAERQLMLVEWNQTTREAEFAKCVHELFAEQAKRTPQSTAVAHGQQSLTYAELDRQSNQAARYLRKLGVRPEVRVGVCMERTLEWVVALLGILKAGGAYVPLDANYPAERLAYMVEDSQLALVLTQQKTHDRLGEVAGDWVCLDQRWAEIAKQDDGKFAGGATPENLVYVIYTSGSTGKPKGVGVPHRGLENLITWHQKTYELTPADRATQVASQAFDASVWEMWPYLLSGSSLDLPDQEVLDQPAKLFEWLAERKITICFLPTPLAEVLGSTQPLPKLHLRALLTGGDKLHEGPWSSLPCPITNHYGPTENTVVSTCIRANSGSVPPIGKPIANVRAYVLDEAHQPVPIGVAGELHVGGASLARGYVNRPGLTAERFVPDPFSNVPGERLYQTGDVVRFLADGNLEFLGRKDHQVKLRGYRIELGEIESALAVHPQVKHAVAMVREDGAAEKRLVAYVVPQDRSTPLDTNELRVYLQGKLPAYMVPAAWVELHELPLTTNGKVNRQALPAPQRRAESQRRPRTPREETLCEILAEVLSMDRVGIDDDFFALGGHSLMATRVVSQVRAALGVELSLRTIFAAPTVGEMSRHLGLDQQPVFNTKAYANPAAVRRG